MKSFNEFINEGKQTEAEKYRRRKSSPYEEARLKKRDQLRSQGKSMSADMSSKVKDTKGERSTPLQDSKKRKGVSEDW